MPSSMPSHVQTKRNWLIWLVALILLSIGGFALWRLLGRGDGPPDMSMGGGVPVTLEHLQPTTLQDQAAYEGN